MQLEPVKDELLKTDETFRSLYNEHRECKERLSEIRDKSLTSEDDENEIKRIKLHKLTLKDRMEAQAREYVQAPA